MLIPLVESDNNEITQLVRDILSQILLKEGDPHYNSWWKLYLATSGIKIIVEKIMGAREEANFIESVTSLSSSLESSGESFSLSHDMGAFIIISGIIELLCSKVIPFSCLLLCIISCHLLKL